MTLTELFHHFFTRDGKPTISWRAMLVQNVDPPPVRGDMFWKAEEAWDGPMNSPLGKSRYGRGCHLEGETNACVFAVSGVGTPFSEPVEVDKKGYSLWPPGHIVGPLPHDLVLVLSVRQKSIQWMQPGDLDLNSLTSLPPETTCEEVKEFGGSVCLGFPDLQVWEISGKTPLSVLIPFLTMTSSTPPAYGREKVLRNYRIDKTDH